ncbi:sugar-binding transcriptional regulator [Evansella cellulosilytica]|uniref:Transcriptional regulator, DeoR family n=1 Tax=Evansella cellulosilytica (strain ATCC 21833 / DSM 2522 / FERM P-1141 / JCM 9156 / N-4) TaxID=649639 RepID=E6TRD2_EVAC2|nr:sugar-binding domain-containing protein [Evansella cellulosilytica]ADU31762.1 transcriptional regulator, DeoR family [Evansella cellulosilytica DSM 2522]
MKMLLDLQKKLLPDLVEVLGLRYRVLRYIRLMQPIGRRTLANNLEMSERILRSEVTFLKEQGLLDITASGMTLTEDGLTLLTQLEEVMKEVFDIRTMEKQLKELLQLKEVYIVPGNSDMYPWVKKEMGRTCVSIMKKRLYTKGNTIAVTGGTTIAAVAEMVVPDMDLKEALFVPARGGLGEQVENQANTICATMARKAMGTYKLLHVPDQLSKEAYQSLVEEPSIKHILELIHSANMVIHSIGEAHTMANRRNSSNELIEKLKNEHAVAEAFGYYFNETGDIIHKVLTIGLQLEDLKDISHIIAVSGGTSKARAIKAYMKHSCNQILVTDEAAAKEILNTT